MDNLILDEEDGFCPIIGLGLSILAGAVLLITIMGSIYFIQFHQMIF